MGRWYKLVKRGGPNALWGASAHSIQRLVGGPFRLQLELMRLVVPLLFFCVPLYAADKSHLDFRDEARAAYGRKDYAAAKAAIVAALALRPDSPRYLHDLAAFSLRTGDEAGAIAALQRLAALGVTAPIERDPDLAPLQGTPAFRRILQQFAANREPQGEIGTFAELPGRTGVIEGIAFRPRTGDVFLSDVHHRTIWRRDRSGQLTRFTADDEELLGIFGLALDEPRGGLWAALAAIPEMAGFTPDQKGRAALAEFELLSGEIRRIVPIPDDGREHGLGDLAVASNGTVYATDAKAPTIWKLNVDAEDFEKVADSPLFSSLQGIVLMDRLLVVADYGNGLFTVDPVSGAIKALAPPKDTTLLGLDGLVAIPGGLVATQNGTDPQRVLRIALSPALDAITDVSVIAAGLPYLTDLTLVTLVNDRPTVIAGSGWDGFDPAKTPQPRAHTVRIFQIALP